MSSRRQVLLDSNIIIYASADAAGQSAAFARGVAPVASAISRVEVLGFHGLDATNKLLLERYFDTITVTDVDEAVIDHAIALRQTRKMSLGDAIIAATALVYGLPLATRNVADFRWIAGLTIIDPFASASPP